MAMSDVSSIESHLERLMLERFLASGQREFNLARASHDSEADQAAFDRFMQAQQPDGNVVNLPLTVADIGHTAASAQIDRIAPVIPLHRK